MIYGWVLLLVVAWLVTVVANRASMNQLSHVSGAWVAMSHWAVQGVFYPPLESEGHYGGTRFGPLSVALQAGAHALTQDAVVGPKLLHAVYMLALIAGLWLALAPLRLSASVRLLLAFAPLVTTVGWRAGMTIRHDAFATAIQVWVIALLGRQAKPSWKGVGMLAALAALAPLAKISALWGAAAGLVYLAINAPKKLLLYVPVGLAVLGLGLGVTQWLSSGHFFENMAACLFVQDEGLSSQYLSETLKIVLSMIRFEVIFLLSLPLSLIGVFYFRKHTAHLVASCLLVWLMTAYLMTRSGIAANHLIDLFAISAIGMGLFLAQFKLALPAPQDATPKLLPNAVCVVLLLVSMVSFVMPPPGYGYRFYRAHQAKDALFHLVGHKPIPSAEAIVRAELKPDEHLISEHPLVPVLLGQDPVVNDPFMLRIYFANHPEAEERFIQRVASCEFDACVMMSYVSAEFDVSPVHFGEPTIEAMQRAYAFDQQGRFTVFRPRDLEKPASVLFDPEGLPRSAQNEEQ